MITKNELKKIKSLKLKKNRKKFLLFVAEGEKNIKEFINSEIQFYKIYSTVKLDWVNSTLISENNMKRLTFLRNPSKVLAVLKLPVFKNSHKNRVILCLDNVSDPGNLGTIIRLCDWYGINTILCSSETVDCFNPKVVQASMGSLSRVNCIYCDIEKKLKNSNRLIYGAVIEKGTSIYSEKMEDNSILVIGNESKGISNNILKIINNKISIPKVTKNKGPESLNAASAASIIISNFFVS
ncbi:MAG: RNA methyltransferase [Flavobacteriaceae bacterium]|nr:RNA methyltransferase [Flavobacteriaceae bacterium]